MKNAINIRFLLNEMLLNPNYTNKNSYEIINFIHNNLNEEFCSIEPVLSYSSDVYVLDFNNKKFLIKIRPVDTLMRLSTETKALEVLSKEIITPNIIVYGVALDYEVIIYDYIESNLNIKNTFLDEQSIYAIWELILTIQNTLLTRSDLFCFTKDRVQTYALNVHRYTSKYIGEKIPLNILTVLDKKLCLPQFSNRITVFSDRSLANWIFSKKSIIPIDFDLLFLEPCLADFIQFIDHHELQSVYDRDSLISKCLSFLNQKNIFYSDDDFHFHALYRNLVQGAIFYQQNKLVSLWHYEKALSSSLFLGEVSLEKQIKKILVEVA